MKLSLGKLAEQAYQRCPLQLADQWELPTIRNIPTTAGSHELFQKPLDAQGQS